MNESPMTDRPLKHHKKEATLLGVVEDPLSIRSHNVHRHKNLSITEMQKAKPKS